MEMTIPTYRQLCRHQRQFCRQNFGQAKSDRIDGGEYFMRLIGLIKGLRFDFKIVIQDQISGQSIFYLVSRAWNFIWKLLIFVTFYFSDAGASLTESEENFLIGLEETGIILEDEPNENSIWNQVKSTERKDEEIQSWTKGETPTQIRDNKGSMFDWYSASFPNLKNL